MSTNLPTSKAGDAIGDNSTLMNRTPSDGRTARGDVISQDTCARTLKVIRARDQGKSKIIIICSTLYVRFLSMTKPDMLLPVLV